MPFEVSATRCVTQPPARCSHMTCQRIPSPQQILRKNRGQASWHEVVLLDRRDVADSYVVASSHNHVVRQREAISKHFYRGSRDEDSYSTGHQRVQKCPRHSTKTRACHSANLVACHLRFCRLLHCCGVYSPARKRKTSNKTWHALEGIN